MRLFYIFLSIVFFSFLSSELTAQSDVNTESAAPGINDAFKDTPEDVEMWAERFSGESREVFNARFKVLEALNIMPGDKIADIGAGTGIYVQLFANAAGTKGRVFAVDIFESFLEFIDQNAAAEGIENITTVLGGEKSTNLAPESVDIAFHSDTYHHFEYPADINESLYSAVKNGGHLFVLDFERIPGVSSDRTLEHVRASKETVIAEIESSGFDFIEEVNMSALIDNYLLKFRKSN